MNHAHPPAPSQRRPVNLSLAGNVVAEARALGLNLSQIAEVALAAEVQRVRARRWADENRAALIAQSQLIEAMGPLSETAPGWWSGGDGAV